MSAVNRATIVDRNLAKFIEEWTGRDARDGDLDEPVGGSTHLTGRRLLDLIDSQFQSRHLDFEARNLKARNEGWYTIGSTGHEGNAAVAAALRPTDMAFLHYRSGAFFCERAKQVPGQTPIFDVLLGLVASADDPIAGGRHKVFGSVPLWIPPQTSTIASQVPKAVGAALALEKAARLGLPLPIPDDSVIVCSFGDASANHSTAVGAINMALWWWFQGTPVPILFVCEDNGIGISVDTPPGWIEHAYGDRNGLAYVQADGLDLSDAYDASLDAVRWCREKRQPTFLHVRTVRMLGHAGSDVETEYHSREEIEVVEARDPLIQSCRLALEAGIATRADLLNTYESVRARVAAAAREVVRRPMLTSAAQVMAPLAPHSPERVKAEAERADYDDARLPLFGGDATKLPEASTRPRHFAVMTSLGMRDMLAKYPEMIVFGEDVAKKGGVYHATDGLQASAGAERVFDTLLDEQSILGIAIGAAHLGMLPVPEIQYLAYYHNAEDQIRGEAASLQYFSNGQYRNPMVVRINAFGYQKGFGGHFHNDNSIAALRDVPGVVICAPCRGDEAVGMMRTAMALAKVDGRVVLFLEPIALFMTKDLYDQDDGLWMSRFPAPGWAVPFGKARVLGDATKADLAIITFGNGVWLSLRAARTLEQKHGLRVRVVDLRWLNPLDEGTICAEARAAGSVLVVDEGRRTGGLSEGVITALVERLSPDLPRIARYAGEDTYVPLGTAWTHVLPSESGIVEASLALMREGEPSGGAR